MIYIGIWCVGTSGMVNGECVLFVWPPGFEKVAKAVGFIHFFLSYGIPLILMVFCYGKMIFVLKAKTSLSAGEGTSDADRKRSENMKRTSRNILKKMFTVFIFFCLTWTWSKVYFLLVNFGLSSDWSGFYHVFGNCISLVNSIINPVIYMLQYEQLQEALKETTAACCGRRP